MASATELLNELESKRLVPEEIIASLRAQVVKAAKPVAAQTITRLLVEKGHLTPPQVQKLLGAPAAAAAKPGPLATATKQAARAPATVASATATQPIADDLTSPDGLEPLDALSPLDELQPLDGLSPLAESAAAAEPAPLDPLAGDGLFGGPLTADPLAAAQPGAASAARKPSGRAPAAQPKPRAPRSPVTTLLLAANGLACVALLAAAALAFWPRASGEAEFQQAEAEFAAKNDAAASEQYELLLARFPQHPQSGLARVHLALAKMRAAGRGSDWKQLLPVAKQVLPEIDALPELGQIQAELAPLIANMAIGLAEQAAAGKTPEQLAAAKEASALANNGRYVPGNLRPWQQLALAEESLAVAEYQMGAGQAQSAAAPEAAP